MGLAYNLDTTENPFLGLGLSNYFVKFPQYQVTTQASEFSDNLDGISFFDQETSTAIRGNGWNWRWCGKKGTDKETCQGIFPTGEFIIRDITFVNGHYAIVGSYKATFIDLYGVGNHGEAWDGFLMIYRGYSDNVFIPFGVDGIPSSSPNASVSQSTYGATGIGILPMRMPYDILPSSTASVTENMSDVGLYCVDIWRGGPSETLAPQPGGGDPNEAYNICLWLGGTQGVGDPVGQGMTYTNIDRIAFGMVGIFGSISYPNPDGTGLTSEVENYHNRDVSGGDSYAVVGGDASIIQFNTRANQTMKIAWNVSVNDTMYDGVGIGTNEDTGIWRGCKIENSLSIYVNDRPSGGAYTYNDYEIGWLPNGLNICTGDGRADTTTAVEFNYYPKRLMGVQGYSSQTTKIGGVSYNVTTPAQFCGDAWVGTDNPAAPTPNAKSYPMVMAAAWNPTQITMLPYEEPPVSACGSIRQPPFLQMGVAYPSFVATAGGVSNNAVTVQVNNDTAVLIKTTDGAFTENYNGLQNSYFAFTTLPYEEIGSDYDTGGFNPSERSPLRYFFLNNLPTQDGTTGAGIFTSEEDPFKDGVSVSGFVFTGSVSNRISNTPIPITMPNKWTSKFQQTRTFTTQEEDSAKSLLEFPSTQGISDAEKLTFKVYNSRNGEAVGIKNNYPRLGIEPFNPEASYDPTFNSIAQQGSLTNEAQGAVGWKLVSDVENPTGAVLTTSFNTDCTPIKSVTIGISNQISPPPPAPTYFLASDPSYPVGGYPMTLNIIPPCSNNQAGKFEPTVVDVPGSTVPIQAGNIIDGGDGWQVGQQGVFITGTSSTGAGVTNGNMQQFTVNAIYDGGVGYTIGGKSTTTLTGSGSGLTINVSAVSAVGEITAYSVINGGLGYKIGDTIQIVDAGATTVAVLTISTIDRNTLGVEPVVCIFDSGGGWIKDPSYDASNPNYSLTTNYSNSLQNRGATFNSKILTDPNSTSRIALGCSWDNDRDQWLFLFGNYTAVVSNQGVSVVSATSTFTDTARFGSAYLDQSKNFNNVVAFSNAVWQSFPMTNNLDGVVFFGATTPAGTASSAGILDYSVTPDQPQGIYGIVQSTSTRSFPTQRVACAEATDPTTISYNLSRIKVFNLDGSTGRQAFVWVDYILFDGADAVIATKLRERGMKVTIDSVEWFKRKIINRGDLNIKQEEIEDWMRQQQDEFSMMMRDAERMGRVRKRKKQVSAYALDALDSLNTDFEDKEVQEFMKDYLPKSRPPTPEEEMIQRQQKGGYSPQAKSYFDEVFEN